MAEGKETNLARDYLENQSVQGYNSTITIQYSIEEHNFIVTEFITEATHI
jgi:hypothetical protein